MDPVPSDPVTTRRLFEHDRVAAGYASGRPFLHPEAFARVRELIRPAAPVPRALDVGCGTGLSTVALSDLARTVTGVDAALAMLRQATKAEPVRYVASTAEALPFRRGSFDLIAACGSIDWVDRPRFLRGAEELLVSGGWLIPLDFGDAGRSREVPGLKPWYDEVFRQAFPRPPSPDPLVTSEEAARFGFSPPATHPFASDWAFTAGQYAEFLMTESNVIAAVEYGVRTAADTRAWLEAQLLPLFGGESRALAFGGYIQLLRKP
jgi:SAM-dependent methyltransferase